MVIQCKECGTKFKFDESRITGDGAWLRCSRCSHVFFEKKPAGDEVIHLDDIVRDDRLAAPEPTPAPERQEPAAVPAAELPEEPPLERAKSADVAITRERKRPPWTPVRIGIYLVLVVIVLGGVYLWLFPQIGEQILGLVYSRGAEKAIVAEKKPAPPVPAGGINFSEVRERFLKNLILSSDLLVIQGVAVNDFDYPVSKIKIKGKILDSAGKLLGEIDIFAGNIMTDEELVKLTDKEMAEQLSKAEGSDVSNLSIAPKGKIPFMAVFVNPPKEVDEFIIELVGFERPAPTSG